MPEKELRLTALQLEEGLALLRAFDVQKILAEVLPVVEGAPSVKGALAKIFLQGDAGLWNTLFNFLGQAGNGSLLRKAVLIARSDTPTLRNFKTDAAAEEDALWKLADEHADVIVKEAVSFFSAVVPTLQSALQFSGAKAQAAEPSPLPEQKRTSKARGKK